MAYLVMRFVPQLYGCTRAQFLFPQLTCFALLEVTSVTAILRFCTD